MWRNYGGGRSGGDEIAVKSIVGSRMGVLERPFQLTMVSARGNDAKQPNQATGLARPIEAENPLPEWEMYPTLVTEQAPDLLYEIEEGLIGEVWFGQFRDPHVWVETHEDGEPIYYQLMGSGIRLGEAAGVNIDRSEPIPYGGTAILYSSRDLVEWVYHGPIFTSSVSKDPRLGSVWELPVLLPLGEDLSGQEKHGFFINPWFSGFSPHAVKYVFYWIRTWDRESLQFVPDHEEARLFDYGEHFTGPSGTVDDEGRSILWSITQDRRTEQAHFESGWAHNAGLPLVLGLNEDDTLRIEPIPELAGLRGKKLVDVADMTISEANEALEGVGGDLLEIRVRFGLEGRDEAIPLGVFVRQSERREEETAIYLADGFINVDRNKSTLSPDVQRGVHGGEISLEDELDLHIYVDWSMVEAYANNRKSLTTRVYPTLADAVGVELFGNARVIALEVWEMGSAYGDVVPAYYEAVSKNETVGSLANHSFQTCDLSGWEVVRGNAFKASNLTAWDQKDGITFYQAQDGLVGCHFYGNNPEGAGDLGKGAMRSASFVLGGDGQIDFLIGGGGNIDQLYVALLTAEGEELFRVTGPQSEQYMRVRWDSAEYIGEELFIEVVDTATGALGHLNLDDFNVPTVGEPDPFLDLVADTPILNVVYEDADVDVAEVVESGEEESVADSSQDSEEQDEDTIEIESGSESENESGAESEPNGFSNRLNWILVGLVGLFLTFFLFLKSRGSS